MDGDDIYQINSLINLPFSFELNMGQKANHIRFLTRGREYTAFFTPNEVIFTLQEGKKENSISPKVRKPLEEQSNKYNLLKMKMEGSNSDIEIIGEELLEGRFNYLIDKDTEKWITNVPTYRRIKYKEIYPGIDLIYYGNEHQLEHDFIVQPNIDPKVINLSFEGAENIEVDKDGHLIVETKTGRLKLLKPIVYQDINGKQQEIKSSYEIRRNRNVGFILGKYNNSIPLRIDPVLSYSTFLGGSNGEIGYGITTDKNRNAYITGTTASNNFPTTEGSYNDSFSGVFDVFITKLNPSGTALVYSTFLGGSYNDYGNGITIDSSGNVYVTGQTNSSNFPTSEGAYNRIYNGTSTSYSDVFVTKFALNVLYLIITLLL